MKDPTPAKGKAAPALRQAATPVATEVRVAAKFYRRMKPHRVFPLVVELQGQAASAGAPVFIHPFIPGAHVVPAEQALDPATANGKATFYVTPLAKGPLRGARLDVFHQGRLVQEVPLAMRAVTQRLTWVLALLTVLVPAFLLYTTVYRKLQGVEFATRVIPVNAAPDGAPGAPEKLDQLPKEDGAPGKSGAKADGDEEEAEEGTPALALAQNKGGSESQPAAKPKPRGGRGSAPPGGPPAPDVRFQTVQIPLNPGEALEREINRNVPDKIVLKDVDQLKEDSDTAKAVELPLPFMRSIASGLGEVYNVACNMAEGNLSFWIGLGLLLLTVVSAIMHMSARGRRRGQPLVLAAGGVQPPHG